MVGVVNGLQGRDNTTLRLSGAEISAIKRHRLAVSMPNSVLAGLRVLFVGLSDDRESDFSNADPNPRQQGTAVQTLIDEVIRCRDVPGGDSL